ncbi:hypothetical protein PIGHUM_00026 [Pigmentiphaga humi]|uniref:DUF2239 domain-containing protein n=1 Tax=Pigmentiphaga humi TaxID=2478468 RepID=A0A3P4AX73_9BURK|nr:DUF2239 family protein [Pigmentiphaga humi]VCU67980.1 hypothetical protein PIGHUM_00026 [Pigmentiphaga humi]
MHAASTYTTFDGYRCVAAGPLLDNVLAVKRAQAAGAAGPVLVFDDATGRAVDVDTRGSEQEIATRLAAVQEPAPAPGTDAPPARGRGRPRMGVVPREVTLLPRHWEWLAAQPGGASVALRKLVEEARRANAAKDRVRRAQERAYHFMSAMAGDLAGFEEAARALFAGDRPAFQACIADWPADVSRHAERLAFEMEAPGEAE